MEMGRSFFKKLTLRCWYWICRLSVSHSPITPPYSNSKRL